MIGGVGWYRKDFSLPEASRALEWAVRFESVNYRSRVWLNGKRDRLQPRRLHPVRVPPQRPQAARHEPAGDPRRLQAPRDRLPALRPRHQRHADRRLVELLGPPARGLPQAPQRRRLEVRARDARCSPARAAPRPCASGSTLRNVHAGGQRVRVTRQLRLAPHRPRHPRHPRQRGDLVQRPASGCRSPRVWSPAQPEPLQRQPDGERGRAHASAPTACGRASARSASPATAT